MTTGFALLDSMLIFVGAWYVIRAAILLLGNIVTFVHYRRMDGKDHPSIRQ